MPIFNPPSSAPSDHDGGGTDSTALGTSAAAAGAQATAYGDLSNAAGADGVAIGYAADDRGGADNVAIGSGSEPTQAATVTVVDFSQGAGAVITLTQPGPVVTVLTEGVDYTIGGNNDNHAQQIRNAINNNTVDLQAERSGAVVTITGVLTALTSDTPAAQTVSLNLPVETVSIGKDASASTNGIAIGSGAHTDESSSIAIGRLANVLEGALTSIAIGEFAGINGGAPESVAIGHTASASQPRSVSVGKNATCLGTQNVAIGAFARASGGRSIAIGSGPDATVKGANASNQLSIVIGSESEALHQAIVLGHFAKSTASGQVVIGGNGVGELSSLYFGQGASGPIGARTVRFQGSKVDTTETDTEGTTTIFSSGEGTGDGTPSSIGFETPNQVGAGSAQQTLTERLGLDDAKAAFSVPVQYPSFAKASLPSASVAGRQIYVTDDVGGAVMAQSNGSVWQRLTDLATVA